VLVDVEPDTLNLDPVLMVAAAITAGDRAICRSTTPATPPPSTPSPSWRAPPGSR